MKNKNLKYEVECWAVEDRNHEDSIRVSEKLLERARDPARNPFEGDKELSEAYVRVLETRLEHRRGLKLISEMCRLRLESQKG